MAKRTRYPNRTAAKQTARRAQRPPADEARTRPAVGDPIDAIVPVAQPDDTPMRASAGALTDAEMRRAEELEAEMVAKERAAIAESLRRRNRSDADDDRPVGMDVNAPLSVRAAHEYAYVARDVRRIGITAGAMILILAVLHVLVNVLGVISI